MRVRAESKDKKVRDTAKELLNKLRTTKFIGTLIGCIDIYKDIATASCDLQKVEQWEVLSKLNAVIKKLDKMSQTLKILPPDSDENDESENCIEVDQNEWPHLAKHLEELKLGKFNDLEVGYRATMQAAMEMKKIYSQYRIG